MKYKVLLLVIVLSVLFLFTYKKHAVGLTKSSSFDPTVIRSKVALIIYDPILENYGNIKLHEYFLWSDPRQLANQLVVEFSNMSHGNVQYEIVETIERDEWPLHINGQRYTDDLYITETNAGNWTLGDGDYAAIISSNNLFEKINAGYIDEVWLYGAPGFNWFESRMIGRGAYFINSPPMSIYTLKPTAFMGLSYEREIPEALESFGHRVEDTIRLVYSSQEAEDTHFWNKFTLHDRDLPGKGGIGTAHAAFNARPGIDYDWDSRLRVATTADDWVNFPNLTGQTSIKNCQTWGCNNIGYFNWWYSHMPHIAGFHESKLNNWWKYIADVAQFTQGYMSVQTYSDYAENNINQWNCWADEGDPATCSNSSTLVKVGNSSIKLMTSTPYSAYLLYPAADNANYDLRSKKYLTFWMYVANGSVYTPVVYLTNDQNEFFTYSPASNYGDHSNNNWHQIVLPLEGSAGWVRTSTGNPSLANIDHIQLAFDSDTPATTLYVDGVSFANDLSSDVISPIFSTINLSNNSSYSLPFTVSANVADNTFVAGVELYVDGVLITTDNLSPYKILLTDSLISSGVHNLQLKAYDVFGNVVESQNYSVTIHPTPVNSCSCDWGVVTNNFCSYNNEPVCNGNKCACVSTN